MCSSSKGRGDGCGNLVELINGPIGNLVGIGVKAMIDRASAASPNRAGWNGNVSAKVPKEHNKDIEKLYDNIEAHLKGTLRVLKPAMEIKNILYGECRSAGHEKPGGNSSPPLVYYTPQNRKICQANCCLRKIYWEERAKKEKLWQGERVRCSRSQVSVSTSSHSHNAQSTPCKIPSQTLQPSDSRCKRLQINVSRIEPLRKKLCEEYETEKETKHADKSQKSRSESRQNKIPRCLICNVTLRDNSLLAILPCKHSFCYPCLRKSKGPKCQKCNESFDMKDVTQFSTLL